VRVHEESSGEDVPRVPRPPINDGRGTNLRRRWSTVKRVRGKRPVILDVRKLPASMRVSARDVFDFHGIEQIGDSAS
jgi:hypothetical protein